MSQRPLSPHLQIYRLQLTSLLSITHRATGIGLAVGAPVLTWWLMALATGAEAYGNFTMVFSNGLGIAFLVGWTWALFYHLANGIRHLFWDMGTGLELTSTYTSGWVVVITSVILTAACWIIAMQGWGL